MMAQMRRARSALARYCSAFGIPRSANTFPLLGVTSSLARFFFLPLPLLGTPFFIKLLRRLQTLAYEFDLPGRSLGALFRLLLKDLQDVDGPRELDRVHRPVGVSLV